MRKRSRKGHLLTHGRLGNKEEWLLRREGKEKAQEEAKSQKKESLLKEGLVLPKKVFEILKAILDAYEARQRLNQTNEETYGAYPNPEIETKHRKIF